MVNKKLTNEVLLEGMTKDQQKAVLDRITQTVAETKQLQSKQVGANVELVLQALKRIESDMLKRVDGAASVVENRVKTIKDGRDGVNGADGRAGRDGRDGKNGTDGRNGKDGINGVSGERGQDGVGVRSAHVDFDGSLIISLTDGQELNAGEVVPFDVAEKIRVISNGGGTSQFVIDTLADLQSQIDNFEALPSQTGNAGKFLTTDGTTASWASVAGNLSYQGTWNASTNTPTLTSGAGTNGYYYIVSTAGSTNLDGLTDWQIGDWLLFNGASWQKIDQTNLVTSVSGRTGAVTLTYSDLTGTVPTWDQNTTGTASNVTGTVAVSNGGTGSTTASGARTNLGLVIGTDVLAPNGSAASLTSFPTLNQNTTGNAATATTATNVSGGTASVTTLTTSSTVTHNGGTANGVAYLNGSKVLTTGSALTFDGTNLVAGAGGGSLRFTGSAGNKFIGQADALITGASSGDFGLQATNNIVFAAGGTSEQMRLTSTGLGIGTSSPAFKLDVSGGNARVNSGGSTTDLLLVDTGTTSGNVRLRSESNALKFITGGGVSATLDSSGNLGLGVTPSAWNSLSRVIQFGSNGTASFENYAGLTNNMYYNGYRDSSNVARYVLTDRAARFGTSTNGGFNWELAPSGTAGNAISFTQAMTLNASGGLSLGVTTDPGAGSIQLGSGAYVGTGIGTGNTTGTYYGTNEVRFYTSAAERARIDSSGQMSTTNGAGVVALAYDCRAWVNFNGTGTVAIRASGNVSSITDNGVGVYTVNFATAMPDASYSAVAMIRADTDYAPTVGQPHAYSAQTTSQLILKTGSAYALEDSSIVTVAIFR